MSAAAPHFLLFSESRASTFERSHRTGRWRFVLESVDGSAKLEASDEEPEVVGERLELLAVVRGLEALDQPSRVTLVTPSRYVSRGLRHGLEQWRESGWQWERFGEMAPVKNGDLWKRVDRALTYHRVECRTWRFDPPHNSSGAPSVLEHDTGTPFKRNERPKRQRSLGLIFRSLGNLIAYLGDAAVTAWVKGPYRRLRVAAKRKHRQTLVYCTRGSSASESTCLTHHAVRNSN